MNRREREVRSTEQLIEIMEQCKTCRLAMHDGESIYVVPLTFAYQVTEDDGFRLWFHGAPRGKKLTLLEQNPIVGFEMDCNIQLIESRTPCSFSYTYMSLIGNGRVTFLDDGDIEAKREALHCLLHQQAGYTLNDIPDQMLYGVKVFYLDVEDISGKVHV